MRKSWLVVFLLVLRDIVRRTTFCIFNIRIYKNLGEVIKRVEMAGVILTLVGCIVQ